MSLCVFVRRRCVCSKSGTFPGRALHPCSVRNASPKVSHYSHIDPSILNRCLRIVWIFFFLQYLHEKQSWLYWPSFLSLNGGVNNDAKHVLDLYSVELEQEETNEAAEAPSRQPEEVQLWCHEWMKRKKCNSDQLFFFQIRALTLDLGQEETCVYSVCLIWQESVELLGKFKEFMMKYNKVYSSQEGQWMRKIAARKSSAVYECLSRKI